jgi:hypothetical protein
VPITDDVRPSSSGQHKVILKTENDSTVFRNAKGQADHFCEKKKQTAYILKEGHQYSGYMDEKDYKTGKKAAQVAVGIGSAGYVLGGKKESQLGGLVGFGGAVASETLGEGYTYTMIFECK